MTTRIFAALTVLLACCAASPAPDSSEMTAADVRCLIISLAAQAASDSPKKEDYARSAVYFIGRLDGRSETLNLEDAVVAELRKIGRGNTDNIVTEATRCGDLLISRAEVLGKIFERFTKRK
jgi:hypothetical protein